MSFGGMFGGFRPAFDRGGALSVPILHVQSDKNTSGGTSCAFSNANTAGNLLIVTVRWATGTVNVTGATDTQGNSYTMFGPAGNLGGGKYKAEMLYATNCAAGANTVTVAFTGAAAAISLAVHEYSGIALTNALDQDEGATALSGKAADSGNTAATSQPNILLFGYVWMNAIVTNLALGAPYTKRQKHAMFITGDQVVAAIGTYNVTATWTTSRAWGAYVWAFRGITPT